MDEAALKECFDYVVNLTKICGPIVKDGIINVGKVNVKENFWDLVTEYDEKVEDILIKGILQKYPKHKIMAEESQGSKKPELSNDPTWIIDPIDGTINFVHGIKLIAISVALSIDKDIKIGIVFNPCTDELFTSLKGHGSYLNNERIFCSKATTMKTAVIGHETSLASLESVRIKNIERVRAFISECIGIRSFGCAALSLAYVAQGIIDAYQIDDLKPWDVAAGVLLIREAGGVVINTNGGLYDILKPNIITAGTVPLSQAILKIVLDVNEKFNITN